MRISDWCSDVCSSDLQPDYFKMPGMAVMKEIFMSAESVTPARLRMFMEGALVHDKSVIDDELVNERHALMLMQNRSEERRVGKACVSPCRYRGSPYH